MDCGGKGRVARDIATCECSIYMVENEHDVVIGPRLHFSGEDWKELEMLVFRVIILMQLVECGMWTIHYYGTSRQVIVSDNTWSA